MPADNNQEVVTEETVETTEELENTEAAAAEEVVEEAETETAEEAENPEEEPKEETKGKRFWQKAGAAKAPKKDKKDEQIEELKDKVTRQLAEFENYRKRTEAEKLQNYTVGAKDAIEKLLPVIDNFERGLANADLSDPFAEGMDKVYKQMITIFDGMGVKPIESLGKEFDPNFHNAIMAVEDDSVGENIIVEEFQKGYTYKDQVIRYAMVKVANAN